MNLNTKKLSIELTGWVTVLLILISATSCSKKEEQSTLEGGNLVVTVKGIEEAVRNQAIAVIGDRVASRAASAQVRSTKNEIVSLGGLDALIDFDENGSTGVVENKGIAKVASIGNERNNQLAANSAVNPSASYMAAGTKYRFLLYNATNDLVNNQIVAVGANPLIQLDGGKSFKWYAVSLNNTSDVPNINSNGVITKAGLTNKDILYASGDLNTVNGTNYLNITFKRRTAVIQMRLDARGVFGSIENSTRISIYKNQGNENIIQMGDMDVRTGLFSNITPVVGSILGSEMVSELYVPGTDIPIRPNTVKRANFHTVSEEPIPVGSLKCRFDVFKVKLIGDSIRTFTLDNIRTYSFGFAPKIGSVQTITTRFIESPVKIKGILWSRSNLIYVGENFLVDRYQFKFNANGSTVSDKDRDFWNFRARTPDGPPTTDFDPCAAVYPEGVWRMPTKKDWEQIGQPDEKHSTWSWWGSIDYAFTYNRDADYPTNPAYRSNNLFIAFGGYRGTDGEINSVPYERLTFGSGASHYWTSDVEGNNAWAAVASFTNRALVLSWSSLGINSTLRNEGRNVRCVRTDQFKG